MSNLESATSQSCAALCRALCGLFAALLLLPAVAQAADTECAKVKIEIQQKLTMERQGFDAMMKINNGLTTASLDKVNINVKFTDDAGNSVVASYPRTIPDGEYQGHDDEAHRVRCEHEES